MLQVLACLALTACGDSGEAPTPNSTNTAPGTNPSTQAPDAKAPDGDAREPVAVAGIEMPYGELDDQLVRGHFVYPETMLEPLPAIIVVHDWMGLNDTVKATAARLAAQGYMVLAVDLYGGEVATSAMRAGELSRELLETTERADQNLQAAYEFLTEVAGAPSVATLGWSAGGYWSLKSMRLMPGQIATSVVFYSQLDEDAEKISMLDAPVLGLFAANDKSISSQTVRNFKTTADELGRDVEIFIFPDVDHGFVDPDSPNFDPAAAEDAWQKTFSFLARHLGRD